MRQPEAEEDNVVAAVRAPCEEVGADELDPRISDSVAGQSQHLRRGVERGHCASVTQKPGGPRSRSARELKPIPSRHEAVEAARCAFTARMERVTMRPAGLTNWQPGNNLGPVSDAEYLEITNCEDYDALMAHRKRVTGG
jgi:hypothetical protein